MRGVIWLFCFLIFFVAEVRGGEGKKLYVKQEMYVYRDEVVRYPAEEVFVITEGRPVGIDALREVGGEAGQPLSKAIGEVLADAFRGMKRERGGEDRREVESRQEERREERRGEVWRVFFDFDSAEVKGCERVKLEQWIRENGVKRAKVFGYADVLGGKKYNLKLSEKRASNVARILERLGVEVIEARGVGESDRECVYGLNRVVEVKVVE